METFIQAAAVETTALLTVLGELLDDEVLVRRVRRELARRDDALPAWLAGLHPLTPVSAWEMSHELGDGDNVALEVRTGTDAPLTVMVYIDHNLGTVAKDAFVVPAPVAALIDQFLDAAGGDPDTHVRELDLADAGVRIGEAVETGAITYPPFETDTWPAARPLVEWVLEHLPEGGTGYRRVEWSEEDRSLIRFSHVQRGIRETLTADTLAAVDRWEPEYQQAIRSARPQGPASLLAAMGVLDTAPLPDEELDLSDVPGDVHERIGAVAEQVDACCDALLDVEYRTACRRLLADVAAADPQIFRRRARTDTAAAAVVWLVAKANERLRAQSGGLTATALGQWFGVVDPAQRASTMLRALGVPPARAGSILLGTPRYLVSARRQTIMGRHEHVESGDG